MLTNGGDNGDTVIPAVSPNGKTFMNPNKLYGVILAVVGVAAYVTLSLVDDNGANVQNFVLFITPFITMLLVKDKLDDIKETGKTIEHQTNGMLTKRINDALHSAINSVNQTDKEKDTENGR